MKKRAGKLLSACAAAAAAAVLMASPVMAGDWKQGTGDNAGSWWYDLGSGKWAKGWQWIDGDNDGVAERYYFDQNGWLVTGTVTPDGFTVNAEGAWIDGGNVRIMVSTVPGETAPEKEETAAAEAPKETAAETEAPKGTAAATEAAQETAAETEAAEENNTAKPASAENDGESSGGPGTAKAESEKETAVSQSDFGPALVELARTYVGKLRYVYGGYSLETGTDCSGFTKLLFAEFGRELPRGTGDQLGAGTRISADQVQPGDLVFWSNSSGRIYHVGIISGNGMFIHASNTARGWVFEDRLGDMPAPAAYARY
ncbi:MAG: C40 family peptidase [Stomatobaculum sp.]|nr:C40 family peptidase [Stomatobaculum sp.]